MHHMGLRLVVITFQARSLFSEPIQPYKKKIAFVLRENSPKELLLFL